MHQERKRVKSKMACVVPVNCVVAHAKELAFQRLLTDCVGNVDRADGVVDCVDDVDGGIHMV
jgi:hypothetical protein